MENVQNLGKKIGMLDVRSVVQDGKSVVILCYSRRILKTLMDVYGKQLYGKSFSRNYSQDIISYGDGMISFFITYNEQQYKGMRSDFHMIIRA